MDPRVCNESFKNKVAQLGFDFNHNNEIKILSRNIFITNKKTALGQKTPSSTIFKATGQ